MAGSGRIQKIYWLYLACLCGTSLILLKEIGFSDKSGNPAAERLAYNRQAVPINAFSARQFPDLSFSDINGNNHSLNSLLSDKKGIVLAAFSTTCPISSKFIPLFPEIERNYRDRGIAFLYFDPIATDNIAEIRKMAAELKLQGIVVHDADNKLMRQLGTATTAEMLVLDGQRQMVYRGAINDQFGLGYVLPEAKNHYLTSALDHFLANQPIPVVATQAPGCLLDTSSVPAVTTHVTYYANAQPIFEKNCVPCHRAGGAAPFELETYEQVAAHGAMARYMVEHDLMPPWSMAYSDIGPEPWTENQRLSDKDKRTLLKWLKGGMPAGNQGEATPAAATPVADAQEWKIGKPDAIYQIPKPFQIPASGNSFYEFLILPTHFKEAQWMQALELKPTDRRAVHHAIVYVIPPGEDAPAEQLLAKLWQSDDTSQHPNFLGALAPGLTTFSYPEGYAKLLQPNSRLLFNIHYTPYGTASSDQLKIGLRFSKTGKPAHEVRNIQLINPLLAIPPGDENYSAQVYFDTPPMKILGIVPHMHMRGQACRIEYRSPQKKNLILLEERRFDFNWQRYYQFREPVPVDGGGRITATCWYDNSARNAANPNPGAWVRSGRDTVLNEMQSIYFDYIADPAPEEYGPNRPQDAKASPPPPSE